MKYFRQLLRGLRLAFSVWHFFSNEGVFGSRISRLQSRFNQKGIFMNCGLLFLRNPQQKERYSSISRFHTNTTVILTEIIVTQLAYPLRLKPALYSLNCLTKRAKESSSLSEGESVPNV